VEVAVQGAFGEFLGHVIDDEDGGVVEVGGITAANHAYGVAMSIRAVRARVRTGVSEDGELSSQIMSQLETPRFAGQHTGETPMLPFEDLS
jgi:hypothetical protein